jgi:hypothetical protein
LVAIAIGLKRPSKNQVTTQSDVQLSQSIRQSLMHRQQEILNALDPYTLYSDPSRYSCRRGLGGVGRTGLNVRFEHFESEMVSEVQRRILDR